MLVVRNLPYPRWGSYNGGNIIADAVDGKFSYPSRCNYEISHILADVVGGHIPTDLVGGYIPTYEVGGYIQTDLVGGHIPTDVVGGHNLKQMPFLQVRLLQ